MPIRPFDSGRVRSHAMVSSRANRSGERYKSRYSPARAFTIMRDCSLPDIELFNTAAGIPICASCAAWSCMRAINGEITTVVFPDTTAGNW